MTEVTIIMRRYKAAYFAPRLRDKINRVSFEGNLQETPMKTTTDNQAISFDSITAASVANFIPSIISVVVPVPNSFFALHRPIF
jgi:hypothetical protein